MAIYHCNISVASRADGASAVAGAAYISRSRMECERDGSIYDYTRAHGHEALVADLGVSLPEPAPERWSDRAVLWNDVERAERKSDAQLARRIECALPDELTEDEQIALARAIVSDRVADGHVVDACIHRGRDGRNTHLHMLEPLRRCDGRGFLPKSENVYTVRDAEGDERKANAAEFRELKGQGYEKVYKWRRGNEWRRLTATEAARPENAGFRRHGKTPVQETRYLNCGWNDRERAEEWREAIARRTNEALERSGRSERVDHRSYERRGVDRVPQLHEGSRVRAIERRAMARARERGVAYRPVTARARENAVVRALAVEIEQARERLRDAVVGLVRAIGGVGRARLALARSWRRPEVAFAGGTRSALAEEARDRGARARSADGPTRSPHLRPTARHRRHEADRRPEEAAQPSHGAPDAPIPDGRLAEHDFGPQESLESDIDRYRQESLDEARDEAAAASRELDRGRRGAERCRDDR